MRNQALYYKALQDSHKDGIDCRPFIDFMLEVIENSLYKYVDIATETRTTKNKSKNTDVSVNSLQRKILILLRASKKVTIQKIAATLGVTERTIHRALKSLREAGILRRVGSDKTGHWEIISQGNKETKDRSKAGINPLKPSNHTHGRFLPLYSCIAAHCATATVGKYLSIFWFESNNQRKQQQTNHKKSPRKNPGARCFRLLNY